MDACISYFIRKIELLLNMHKWPLGKGKRSACVLEKDEENVCMKGFRY